MKGYAYLDLEGNLIFKDYNYITTENPTFFDQNAELIVKRWLFDTDNDSMMKAMFIDFKNLELKMSQVNLFLEAINFDPKKLKTNVSPVQR